MSFIIKTKPRVETGRPAMKALRKHKYIPAILHKASTEALMLTLTEYLIFEKELRKATDDFYQLEVGNIIYHVRLKEVQRHPISNNILHVDFLCTSG
jgi:large subunit ribosomal protein L25